MPRITYSPDERKARMDTAHAQMVAAVEAISSSDDWRAFLDFAAKLRTYSAQNRMWLFQQSLGGPPTNCESQWRTTSLPVIGAPSPIICPPGATRRTATAARPHRTRQRQRQPTTAAITLSRATGDPCQLSLQAVLA